MQVRPGTYLLEVQDVQSIWPMVRLDVSAKAAGKLRALLTHNRQPVPFPLPLEPLVAKPGASSRCGQRCEARAPALSFAATAQSVLVRAPAVFFEKREGFQWSSMLMNPMVIMMGVTLLIVSCRPAAHAGSPRMLAHARA